MGIIGGADGPTVVYLSNGPFAGEMSIGLWCLLLGGLGVLAYFIGNISPSTIMAKRQGLDIKKEGSGNAGTTNALRVMGKKAGAITCIVDILKGVVAVLIGAWIGGALAGYLCALCVFLGHVWPIVYKFKGGKGVATAFGAVLGVNPLIAVIALAVVAIVVFTSKKMSLGSIIGAATLPILALILEPGYALYALITAVIIIVKHRANIGRLLRHEEPDMGIFKKKDKTEPEDETDDSPEQEETAVEQ